MEPFRVNNVGSYLDGLSNLFDIVRIVNPHIKKVVYQNVDGGTIIHGYNCFEFWDTGKECDNCISSKALAEKKTFTKVEYKGDGVYMVMATPIIFGDDLYVLELLKDISETGVVIGLSGLSTKETNNIISNLKEKVVRDDLTEVYNRRYIDNRLPIDIEDSKKHGENITVIMLDIDYFKEINDIYGHVAGDLVLKKLTDIIRSKIRRNYDWVARYGGDEFLIVLKNSNKEVAMRVIKEIKDTVNNTIIKFGDNSINVTISVGTCTVEPGAMDFDEVIYEIDKNLQKAKKSGKNRIIAS